MISSDSTNTGVVFVVDDDEAMRNSLRWLIESVGHTVETYASAQAFLDNHYPGRSGCLLLDVRMPGMSGLELQSQLESHDIRLPVIILTGHGDVGMAVKAMKAGALDFIEKPFDDELLLATIEKALTEDAEKREERASRAEILARMGPADQRIIADGVFPQEVLAKSVNFRPQCVDVDPPLGIWAHVCGSDLVRDVSVQGRVVAAISPSLFAPADGTITLALDLPGTVAAAGLSDQTTAPPEVAHRAESPESERRPAPGGWPG